jgi:hypothetical protein
LPLEFGTGRVEDGCRQNTPAGKECDRVLKKRNIGSRICRLRAHGDRRAGRNQRGRLEEKKVRLSGGPGFTPIERRLWSVEPVSRPRETRERKRRKDTRRDQRKPGD